jgi:hypothetical protein
MSEDRKSGSGQPAPGEEGGFLSRWSRRKRDIAAQGKATEEVAPPLAEPVLPPPDTTGEPALSEAELAERRQKELDELIAALPRVEDINASTDITGFLDARIPDVLRNAALRATWISDPAIRDFLNDAREYALDYNTPGMAPGYGPLSESERSQAVEFVKTLFSDAPKRSGDATLVEDQTSGDSEISGEESRAISRPEIAAPHHAELSASTDADATLGAGENTGLQPTESGPGQADFPILHSTMPIPAEKADSGQSLAAASEHVPLRRRGGGALPI